METTWQNTLEQLNEYIKNNTDISLGKNMVVIPAEVRTEFYRLFDKIEACLLYTSPSPRDRTRSRMPSSA